MKERRRAAQRRRGADVALWRAARHDLLQWSQSLIGLASVIGKASSVEARRELQDLFTAMAVSFAAMLELLELVENGLRSRGRVRSKPTALTEIAVVIMAEFGAIARHCDRGLAIGAMDGLVVGEQKLVDAAMAGLVLTAIKLSIEGDVEVSSREDDLTGEVVVQVSYHGIDPAPGMSRAFFVEIAALPEAPARPFVGLGLTMVGRVVEHLGGGIEIGAAEEGQWQIALRLPAFAAAGRGGGD